MNVKIEGWIRDLYVDYTGQPIQRGQPLFTLYSPDLLNTQNEYLLALKTRDQMQQSTIADARERADSLVASARQRLLAWDLPAEDLRKLDETRQPVDAVVFRAPVSGFVIEKQAVKGLHVMPGQSLYKVSDLSVVWVEADVYESELAAVRVGDAATVTVDAYPGERFTGRAIYIYPYLDEKTRTNKVRFQLANRGGRLKPGMYRQRRTDVSRPLGPRRPDQCACSTQGPNKWSLSLRATGCSSRGRSRSADVSVTPQKFSKDSRKAIRWPSGRPSSSTPRVSFGRHSKATRPPRVPTGAAAPAGTQITFRTVPDPAKDRRQPVGSDGQRRRRKADRRCGGDRAVLHAGDADDEHAGHAE